MDEAREAQMREQLALEREQWDLAPSAEDPLAMYWC